MIVWFTLLGSLAVLSISKCFHYPLKGTPRYVGLLLAPAEGFGLRPRLFLPIFGIFWSPVITLVTFSSNISNNKKKSKKLQTISKNFKKTQNPKKVQKNKKIKKNKINPKKNKKRLKNPLKKQKNPKIVKNGQQIRKSEKNLKKSQKITFFQIFFFNFFLFF